jgi:3' exoribonuclease, RNase T-like
MRVFYDTEFLEAGPGEPIRLISIGMVRDDGEEYYAVLDDRETIDLAMSHPWLHDNVMPYLPITEGPGRSWVWNEHHPDFPNVKLRSEVKWNVRSFLLEKGRPELWGWFSSYDHVLLSQLFGRMIDLPPGVPMYTNDLKQEVGGLSLPPMPDVEQHNALSDARELRWRMEQFEKWKAEHRPDR